MLKGNPFLGITLIRVVVGLTFFLHGWQKLFTNGIDGVGGFFGSVGIPAAPVAAIIVTFLELLGGLALILGIGTRLVSVLFVFEMLVALLTVHLANGFFVTNNGIELVLLLGVVSAGLALAGPGLYALDTQLFPKGSLFRGVEST